MKIQRVDKILITWILIVLGLIIWPFPDVLKDTQLDYSDKIFHIILFGIVAFLVNGSMRARGFGKEISATVGLISGSAYAGIAEIIQIFVPGRNCSIYDFYAGSIGSIFALIVIFFRKTQKEIKQQI